MARIYSSVVLGALWLGLPLAATADDPLFFLEDDGVVVIEMESLPAQGGWAYEANVENYTGDGYFVWRGQDNFRAADAERGDPIEFNVRIETAGNYQLRWRSYITLGESSTEHNDSWVEFPTGQDIEGELALNGWTKSYMNRYLAWSWDAKTTDHVGNPIRQYFEAGDHLIRVAGRSNGHAIDRIVLYKYDDINYNNAKFTNYAPSATTTELPSIDDPEVTEEEEPVEEVTEEPTPEEEVPESLPALQSENEHPGNECIDGVVSLTARYSASLLSDDSVEQDSLVLGEDATAAFLTFDLSAVPADATQTQLLFYPLSEQTSARLSVYAGSHSDWDSVTDSDSLPNASVLLGEADFNLSREGFQRMELDGSSLGRDNQTLLLSTDTDNDTSTLAEPGTEFDPRLEISGDGDFCQLYDDAVATAIAEQEAAEQEAAELAAQEAAEEAAAEAEREAAEQAAREEAEAELATDMESVIDNVTPENSQANTDGTVTTDAASIHSGLLTLLVMLGFGRYSRRLTIKR